MGFEIGDEFSILTASNITHNYLITGKLNGKLTCFDSYQRDGVYATDVIELLICSDSIGEFISITDKEGRCSIIRPDRKEEIN